MTFCCVYKAHEVCCAGVNATAAHGMSEIKSFIYLCKYLFWRNCCSYSLRKWESVLSSIFSLPHKTAFEKLAKS